MIDGNADAELKKRISGQKNALGEVESTLESVADLTGWLDYTGGVAEYEKYKTKLSEATHLYICDYQDLGTTDPHELQLTIGNVDFDALYIDDPMELHEQLEIYLKKVG